MNKYLIIIYLKLRDFIISNFFVNIYSIEYKETYYDVYNSNKYYILLLLKLIPFRLLKMCLECCSINIIYKLDNVYYKTNLLKDYRILPLILDIYINDKSLKHIIKYYNALIPIHFILNNNNIKTFPNDYIHIKYFKHGDIINKKILISNILHEPLYNIFS